MRTLHTALHNLCNIDHVYMYLDIQSIVNTSSLFFYSTFFSFFFKFKCYTLTEDLVKLCSLKFSFLLFEMVYDIEKLQKQFKFFTKFAKNRKFNSDFPLGKMLGKFLMEKLSPPLRNLVFFSQKMVTRNNDFRSKKHQKVQKY